MAMTTIQIDRETRESIKQFGTKDETYDEILKKIIQIAALHYLHNDVKRMIREEKAVPLDEV
jgi:hypothetical protein